MTRPLLAALAYAGAALLVYAPAIDTFLISDDYYFLGIVSRAAGPSIVFQPLVDRFIRPAVVGLYYLAFHTAGMRPWVYHLLNLLPHVLTAWLVYLSVARMEEGPAKAGHYGSGRDGSGRDGSGRDGSGRDGSGRDGSGRDGSGRDGSGRDGVWAFLAGLLFLVFAGHSEAVAWTAGAADPLLAAAMMTAFYCYLRAIEPDAGAGWLLAYFAALPLAPLAKEAWVVFPGLLVVHALVLGVPAGSGRRRALAAIAGAVTLVAAYLLMRRAVFGSVTGGYTGLAGAFAGSSQIRAFLIRCFLPSGHVAATLWLSRLDRFVWPVLAIGVLLIARGRERRMVAFSGAAMLVALAPMLPLTISVSTTEGERFVYVPSIFSSILTLWGIRSVLGVNTLAASVCAAIVVVHAGMLFQTNRMWRAASTVARSMVDGYADEVRLQDPDAVSRILIVALPDHVAGPFVFRTGFYQAVTLVRPEAAARIADTVVVGSYGMAAASDSTRVTPRGARTLAVDFGANRIVQPYIPSSAHFQLSERTPTSFVLEFRESSDRLVVLYPTGGRLAFAAAYEGTGLPFGSVDIPAGDAVCSGDTLRVAGWALDRDGVRAIRVEEAGSGRLLAETTPVAGVRPDVVAAYPRYADRDRTGWDVQLPCRLAAEAGGTLTLNVVAEDIQGHRGVLAERRIRIK